MYIVMAMALGGSTVGAYLFDLSGPGEELEAIMPVTPMEIELARYISYIIMYAIWLCLLAAYTVTNYLSGIIPAYDGQLFETVLGGFVGWSTMAFTAGVLMFPFLRIMTNTGISARTILTVCLFLLFILSGLISSLLIATSSLYTSTQLFIVVGLFLLYCISFVASLSIHKYKRGKGVVQ